MTLWRDTVLLLFRCSQPWEHQIFATKGIKIIRNSVGINGVSDVEASTGMWGFQQDWNTNIARHRTRKKPTPQKNRKTLEHFLSFGRLFLPPPLLRFLCSLCMTNRIVALSQRKSVCVSGGSICVSAGFSGRVRLWKENVLWSTSPINARVSCDASVCGESPGQINNDSLFFFQGYKKKKLFASVSVFPLGQGISEVLIVPQLHCNTFFPSSAVRMGPVWENSLGLCLAGLDTWIAG